MSASRFRRPTHHRDPVKPQPKSCHNGWEEYYPATMRHSRKGLMNLPKSAQSQIRHALKVLSDGHSDMYSRKTLCGIYVTDDIAIKHAKRVSGKY